MTDTENPKNQKTETVNKELFINVEKVLSETASITGLESKDGKFSFDELKTLPQQVKRLKDAEVKATQDSMKFRIFVDESIKADIKHLDDAYTLINAEISKIDAGECAAKEIKNIVENLKETRPYLFNEPVSASDIPTDFLSDENSGSALDNLRLKALQSGSPQDIQNYWSARKQIR